MKHAQRIVLVLTLAAGLMAMGCDGLTTPTEPRNQTDHALDPSGHPLTLPGWDSCADDYNRERLGGDCGSTAGE